MDGIGAAGATFTGVGMGRQADSYGSDGAFGIVAAMASVATLLIVLPWNLKPLRAEG